MSSLMINSGHFQAVLKTSQIACVIYAGVWIAAYKIRVGRVAGGREPSTAVLCVDFER